MSSGCPSMMMRNGLFSTASLKQLRLGNIAGISTGPGQTLMLLSLVPKPLEGKPAGQHASSSVGVWWGQGRLMDECDILSLCQHDMKPLTIPDVPKEPHHHPPHTRMYHHPSLFMFTQSAVCKWIPRWTRPARRGSWWRSATSSLTSSRGGGSSSAARSRKGRSGHFLFSPRFYVITCPSAPHPSLVLLKVASY